VTSQTTTEREREGGSASFDAAVCPQQLGPVKFWEKNLGTVTVAISLLFDKYYPIMD
jgi:hypothetical protein